MGNILRISEAASIALHAMLILAAKQLTFYSVKEIAARLNVSENHLSKVLQRLVKAGLVVSVKGNKGGFKIAKDPQYLFLLDVYEAIDGKFQPSTCLLNRTPCENNCIMGDLMASINDQVKQFFTKTNLLEFILLSQAKFLPTITR